MDLRAFSAVFRRELGLAWSGGGGAGLPVGFFAGSVSLLPLALGPEPDLLRAAGPAVLWIALALSSLLPMERLFQADLEDGTLDAYVASGAALEGVCAAKMAGHWAATGAPLALSAPLLFVMLQGSLAAAPLVAAIALVGSVAFFFSGAIGAALAAGVRRGGMLIALIGFPLFAPAMIFGATALYAVSGDWSAPLMLTGAVALFATATAPFAAALALRASID
jgi:heme exporter protein B